MYLKSLFGEKVKNKIKAVDKILQIRQKMQSKDELKIFVIPKLY